jgi:hypothetical protein
VPKFDLPKFIYDTIRAEGSATRVGVKEALWQQRRSYTADQIDNAFQKLAPHGVTHNGAKLKKDRIYQLPIGLLTDESPAGDGALSPDIASQEVT